MRNHLTEKEVAAAVGVTSVRIGQLRRGRVSRRGGRPEFEEEPRLREGKDYKWSAGRVWYTQRGLDRIRELVNKPKENHHE